jgi:hypothetical protein
VLIDCDTCAVRGVACDDCVVTVLLGEQPDIELDQRERLALATLAEHGLVPPVRLAGPEAAAG